MANREIEIIFSLYSGSTIKQQKESRDAAAVSLSLSSFLRIQFQYLIKKTDASDVAWAARARVLNFR
jgi:hypothetical protein